MSTPSPAARMFKILIALLVLSCLSIFPATPFQPNAILTGALAAPTISLTSLPVALQQAVLHAPELQDQQQFGYTSDIDGDIAVVGAPYTDLTVDEITYANAGAAYVFQRSQDGVWNLAAQINGPLQANAFFAFSLALSGDTLIIGAPYLDISGQVNQGAASIYQRHQGGENAWGKVTGLVSPLGSHNDHFGYAVDISADTAVASADYEDCQGCDATDNSGATFLFERDLGGENQWGCLATLRASNPQKEAYFGTSVALRGPNLIVGAGWEDFDSLSDAGAAYIFSWVEPDPPLTHSNDSGGWTFKARLTASNAGSNDRYGYSVDIQDDTAVVGAVWEDGGDGDPLTEAGAAYVYSRDQGGPEAWGEIAILRGDDTLQYDYFGASVALQGDRLAIGAYLEDNGPGDSLGTIGSVYLFLRDLGGANQWGQALQIHALDRQADDRLGLSIAMSGDYLISGAYYEDGGDDDAHPNTGAAYIFYLLNHSLYLPALLKP